MRGPRFHPVLRVGERVRLYDGVAVVVRVTPGAAYVRHVYATPRVVTVGDRTFEAKVGGGVLAISRHAAVERVGEE